MKKLLLLFLLIPLGVSADEYKEYDESVVSKNIHTITKYKYYQIQKEEGPYESENIKNEEFPLIDYDNYIYTDYSEWTNEILEKEGYGKTFYKYSTVSDTNKIVLSGFSNHLKYMDITGLKVFYDGEEIPFEAEYFLCKGFFEELEKNGIVRVPINSKITLNLDKEYDTKKLQIKIDYISSSEYPSIITIEHKNDDLVNASFQYSKVQIDGDATIEVNESNLRIKNTEKIIYKEEKVDNGDTFIEEETMYKYRDKLYLKYKENKIYTDYFFENPDPLIYIKDENEYKVFYKELEENTTYETNVKDLSNKNTEVIENPMKLSSNEFKTENNEKISDSNVTYLNVLNKDPSNLDSSKQEEKDYSFLYLFFIIIILFIIKIILLLSKLYKEKKNHAIV